MNDKQQITLNTLEDYEKTLSEKVEQITRELQRVQGDLQNIRGTIQFHKEVSAQKDTVASFNTKNASPPVKPLPLETDPLPMEKLRGLSQPRAMIVLARHFEGYLRPKQLANALISAKLMKKTKNSNSIASRLIRESDRFEKISEGLYKLKAFETQTQIDSEPLDPRNLSRILQ